MKTLESACGASLASKPTYAGIPDEFRRLRVFIPFKLITEVGKAKKRKQAVNPRTLKEGDWNNPNDFVSFDEALALVKENSHLFGVGISFKSRPMINGLYLTGIDLDNIFDDTKSIKSHHQILLDSIDGFVEKSISGQGRHIFVLTKENLHNSKDHINGVEIFSNNGFIALTGAVDSLFSKPFGVKPQSIELLLPYQSRSKEAYDAFALDDDRDPQMSNEELRDLVMALRPSDSGRDTWIKIGMICHHQTKGSFEGLEIWKEYSDQGYENPVVYGLPASISDMEYQWNSFNLNLPDRRYVTHKTLKYWLNNCTTCEVHPQTIDDFYSLEEASATEFIIDGLIAEGIFILAGPSGIGKTTLLLPLAAKAAHLCTDDDELKPRLRRPVLYLTEDKKQAVRILSGLKKHCGVKVSDQEFNNWLKVRETRRMSKEQIADVIEKFADQNQIYSKDLKGNDVLIPPLIIADTLAATLDLEDENNNAQVSKFISAIKQACSKTGTSLWLVAHTSKINSRKDIDSQSARGASAFGGDAHGTGFIIKDEVGSLDRRYLVMAKKRYEADFNELCFTTERFEIEVKNRLGQIFKEYYRVGFASKSSIENRKQEARAIQLSKHESEILKAIHESGLTYVTKSALGALMGAPSGARYQKLAGVVDKLILDKRLLSVTSSEAKARGVELAGNVREVLMINKGIDFSI